MKYAIIADIHGNLEALQVVLEDCKNQKVTHYACLGECQSRRSNGMIPAKSGSPASSGTRSVPSHQ